MNICKHSQTFVLLPMIEVIGQNLAHEIRWCCLHPASAITEARRDSLWNTKCHRFIGLLIAVSRHFPFPLPSRALAWDIRPDSQREPVRAGCSMLQCLETIRESPSATGPYLCRWVACHARYSRAPRPKSAPIWRHGQSTTRAPAGTSEGVFRLSLCNRLKS